MPQSLDYLFSAVREDRMPGGRNSGAVYNLYKVGQNQFFCSFVENYGCQPSEIQPCRNVDVQGIPSVVKCLCPDCTTHFTFSIHQFIV